MDGVIGKKKIRKNFKRDGGPLPQTEVSKLIGFTPNYVGYQPSKPYPVNHSMLKFISEEQGIPDTYRSSILSKRRETWTGSYDSYKHVLKEFTKYRAPKHTSRDYLRILEEEGFPWIKLPKMPPLNVDLLEELSINPDAHPGFFTKLFFGDTRKDTVRFSKIVAEEIFEHLKTKKFKWQGLWCLGGRSKDVKVTEEYSEKVSTRAVWIPEEPLVLLSLLVVQPFTKAIQSIERNCLFIGKNFSLKENQWLSRLEGIFPWSFRCDWSLFDAHVDREMIIAAMALIRRCYPDDRFHTRFFSFLTDTIINKNLVVPPGFVYKISQGMPSGHPLVTLVNTIVNYIVFVTILQGVVGKGNVARMCYAIFSGDDTKVFIQWCKNLLDIDNIIKRITTLECDSVVASLEPIVNSLWTERPDVRFLKRYVNDFGIISWHGPSMLKKIIYNDKHTFDVNFITRWFCSALISAPGNQVFNSIMATYINKQYDKLILKDKTNYWKRQKVLALSEVAEAESVGILTQITPPDLCGDLKEKGEKFLMEKNNRKLIMKFLPKSTTLCDEIMFSLQSILITTGRFSLGAFDRRVDKISKIIKDLSHRDLLEIYETPILKQYKLGELVNLILSTRGVEEAGRPNLKLPIVKYSEHSLALLASFCHKSKEILRFVRLKNRFLDSLCKTLRTRKEVDDTS